MLKKHKVIFWDFDGVLLNSNEVRDAGFIEVLQSFPKEQVAQLLDFHRANGGLSRYVKFRYFFEEIRNEKISDDALQDWANQFSIIMKKLLVNKELLIHDSLNFVKSNYQAIPMHIVSGSDQTELRFLCQSLGISQFFKSIHGSPKAKNTLVAELLLAQNYKPADVVLIGDSGNDYEAATVNSIAFRGYNNPSLERFGVYIKDFSHF